MLLRGSLHDLANGGLSYGYGDNGDGTGYGHYGYSCRGHDYDGHDYDGHARARYGSGYGSGGGGIENHEDTEYVIEG